MGNGEWGPDLDVISSKSSRLLQILDSTFRKMEMKTLPFIQFERGIQLFMF